MTEHSRVDGMPIFDDQLCELMDLLLNVCGVRMTYMQRVDRMWIFKVGDQDLRDGLLRLTDKQLLIIEAFVFDGKTTEDLKQDLDIGITELRIEICRIRTILESAM